VNIPGWLDRAHWSLGEASLDVVEPDRRDGGASLGAASLTVRIKKKGQEPLGLLPGTLYGNGKAKLIGGLSGCSCALRSDIGQSYEPLVSPPAAPRLPLRCFYHDATFGNPTGWTGRVAFAHRG